MDDAQGAPRVKLIETPTLTRSEFTTLLATNPNYFGTQPDLGATLGIDLPAVEEIKADTTYESLACVSFSPERDRLEATIAVKQPVGYGSGLCGRGTREYVRFYVEQGGSWVDAGMGGAAVYDIPIAPDCGKEDNHPLYPVVGADFAPLRDRCRFPQLLRVRAILSWTDPPPPGQPDWTPVWGDIREVNVQVAPRWNPLDRYADDVVAKLLNIEQYVPVPGPFPGPWPFPGPIPIPIPGSGPGPDPAPDVRPAKVLSFAEIAELSRKAQVPDHRFALPFIKAAKAQVTGVPAKVLAQTAVQAKQAGVDLGEVLKALGDASGNTEYEQLRCVGLDEARQAVVATFQVKQSSGFNGGPCSDGSIEYVAFWADWDDTCDPTYLGTVQVRVHDYADLPAGGLNYAAILPINLGALVKPCGSARVSRIRAVLSWGTPPSETDPDALPYWGNRIDRHVQVSPGIPYDGHARLTIVGGVVTPEIDRITGLTKPDAVLAENGYPLDDRGHAFAGLVTIHGPRDDTLVGTPYRLVATNVEVGGTTVITTPFTVPGPGGHPTTTPNPVTGEVLWQHSSTNWNGVLGWFAPAGNDRWDIELQVGPTFTTVDVVRVQMDSILRPNIDPTDQLNAGDLHVNTGAACFVDRTAPLKGTFIARDRHFAYWDLSIHGGPGGNATGYTLTIPAGLDPSSETSMIPEEFEFDIRNLDPCGYVVALTIHDRVIVGSTQPGRSTTIERGICVR